MPLPYLSELPIVGRFSSSHTILVYLAFILVPLASLLIYRTQLGLCLRAAGELPAAVDTSGVNVLAVRYIGLLLCGAFAGLGGAALSIGQLDQFNDNLTAGRGFIALAIVLLGSLGSLQGRVWIDTLRGCRCAATATAGAQLCHPEGVLAIIPYVLAIAAMALFVKRLRLPAALGRPYGRE